MSGQFPPKKLSVAILSRLCYLQRRLTGLLLQHVVVDNVIHAAPDGFAGLRRLEAATRMWLK